MPSPSAAPQELQKFYWIAGGFLTLIGIALVWRMARGADDLEGKDREVAMRDRRRAKIAARREGFWKRAERKLFGLEGSEANQDQQAA